MTAMIIFQEFADYLVGTGLSPTKVNTVMGRFVSEIQHDGTAVTKVTKQFHD